MIKVVSKLHRSNDKRPDFILEATDGGIYEHSIPPEEITYLSKQQANILGYHLDEVPSYHCFTEWLVEQVHPVDRDPLDRAYRDFVAGRAAT